MNNVEVQSEAQAILTQLSGHSILGNYIDSSLGIPANYHCGGEVKLIILGQDPTVKNPASRKKIRCVLNLDRSGNLKNYLRALCNQLGFSIDQDVFATNLIKNFFIAPPTTIKETDIFSAVLPFWLPLLTKELALFPDAPIIILGQPLLSLLVSNPPNALVRDYWGYLPGWQDGRGKSFTYISSADNILKRRIFPFPHQPSISKRFYRERLPLYIQFMKEEIR